MSNARSRALLGVLCTVVGGVAWGISGTCGEYLFSNYSVSPIWVVCVRELGAGAAMLLVTALRRSPGLTGIWRSRKDVGELVLFTLFGLVLCQYAYLTAIAYTNAGTTTVLQNLNMVLIMVLVCISKRRLPVKREVVAGALAILGTFLVATHGNPGQMVLSPEGLFWGLMTAVGVTCYTLLPMRLITKWGTLPVMGWSMMLGGVMLAFTIQIWNQPVEPKLGMILSVAAITVLGSIVAFALYMYGVTIVGPVRASLLATTEPLAATLCSFLWLKTAFHRMDLLGFVCIMATVFLLSVKPEQHGTSTKNA